MNSWLPIGAPPVVIASNVDGCPPFCVGTTCDRATRWSEAQERCPYLKKHPSSERHRQWRASHRLIRSPRRLQMKWTLKALAHVSTPQGQARTSQSDPTRAKRLPRRGTAAEEGEGGRDYLKQGVNSHLPLLYMSQDSQIESAGVVAS